MSLFTERKYKLDKDLNKIWKKEILSISEGLGYSTKNSGKAAEFVLGKGVFNIGDYQIDGTSHYDIITEDNYYEVKCLNPDSPAHFAKSIKSAEEKMELMLRHEVIMLFLINGAVFEVSFADLHKEIEGGFLTFKHEEGKSIRIAATNLNFESIARVGKVNNELTNELLSLYSESLQEAIKQRISTY